MINLFIICIYIYFLDVASRIGLLKTLKYQNRTIAHSSRAFFFSCFCVFLQPIIYISTDLPYLAKQVYKAKASSANHTIIGSRHGMPTTVYLILV